jgi:hypothetical protein
LWESSIEFLKNLKFYVLNQNIGLKFKNEWIYRYVTNKRIFVSLKFLILKNYKRKKISKFSYDRLIKKIYKVNEYKTNKYK